MKARALVLALSFVVPLLARGQVLDLVTGDVPQPIAFANAGDGRLFVASRPGEIYVLQSGAVLPTPFLDIRDLVGTNGEGGLLGIAFHPSYAANGWVFVSYTDNDSDSVVARYTRSASDPNTLDPATGRIVIEVDQSSDPMFQNHRGGDLQFGPDGLLYFGLGDGGSGNDPLCHAQDPGSLLGKLLRLDVDVDPNAPPYYAIPASNPFANEIWASGLRNPWRFSFDRETGDLWIGDVGQNAREEIDVEAAGGAGGRNYGWKREEGSVCLYTGDAPGCAVQPPACGDSAYTRPVFEYDSSDGSHAITGGFVYRGASAPDFDGRYVFADSSTGDVWALAGAPGSYSAERIAMAATPVAFGEDASGELYLADLGNGGVYRVRMDRIGAASGNAACVRAANERIAKYASAAEKDTRGCVALAARAKLGASTLAQCTESDRKGALAKQQTALEKVEQKRCDATPAFGFTGSGPAGAATAAAGRDLATLVFGADLDAAIATRAADRVTAACQAAVLDGLGGCQSARRKAFLRCKKAGLRDGSIDSAEALAACLSSDPSRSVVRACDGSEGKLARRTLPNKCASRGVDLAEAFPGCGEAAVAALAECLDAAGRCAHCRTLDAADGLGADCDLFDDGAANASCSDPE